MELLGCSLVLLIIIKRTTNSSFKRVALFVLNVLDSRLLWQ